MILHDHDGSINVLDDFTADTQADELAYEPSTEDLEWIACVNVDSFLPRHLEFTGWLDEQARQHKIRGGESPEYSYGGWHEWLGGQIARLAQVAVWMDVADPATFDERHEVYERELRERS